MSKKVRDHEESEFCPFIRIEKQKEAPYNRYQIHLSQPLEPSKNSQSRFNPFANTYNQLGIRRPRILQDNKIVNFLKIKKNEEENETKAYFNRKKNYVGSRFLESLQDKDYYPISKKSVILYKHHYIRNEKKDESNLSESKFQFLYKNFDVIQANLQQTLSAFPNRPNDFVSQFGLNIHTPSQDHFLSILYNLNFDILYSSHYICSELIDKTFPYAKKAREPEINIMNSLVKPFPKPKDPFAGELPEFSIEHKISDMENFADILDFNVALKSMQNSREQTRSFTTPITSRHSDKVLMSATPLSQNFFSIYERDKLVSDSVICADIFSYIGLRIRRNQRQEHLELEKTEIGWSQTRIPMRRTLLTSHDMFFEKRKQIPLSQHRSGSNSDFSSIRSISTQMSQASQLSTVSSQTSQSSTTQSIMAGGVGPSSMWNKEQSNPFTSDLFKDQIVSVISITKVDKKSSTDNPNASMSDDENESDSESSFF